MGKKNQSKNYKKKYKKKRVGGSGYSGDDRISELPDEILIFILSLLSMEEAARTSVISNRWKTLWTNLPSLRFDGTKILGEILMCYRSLKTERSKFRGWVSQVVKSCQGGGSNLEEFRLCFDFDHSYKFDINAWLRFAIRKRVKVLELDLADCLARGRASRSSALSFSGCNSLTFLRLNYVGVTGESIEYLLSSCPSLEQLIVESSNSLVDLKVDGPSLKLKILKIFYCYNFKNIEISAKDLVSFSYKGDKMNFSLKNVPRLVELYFDGYYSQPLSYVLCQFSNFVFQLESLTLAFESIEESILFCQIPELYNLKHLKLIVSADEHQSLLQFTSLMEACPFLRKISLELSIERTPIYLRREMERISARRPHKNLKVIEFFGFACRTIDVELATYLIENSCKLEKVIFDTRDPIFVGTTWGYELSKEEVDAKRRAKKFGRKLPRGPDLIII